MAAAQPPTKKMRRPNFLPAELLCLAEEVEARRRIIFGKLDAFITAVMKHQAWEEVTAAVNAVSLSKRTPQELKKKFKDIKSLTKAKAASAARHMQGTGGGPKEEVQYAPHEEVILRLLSPTSFGGLDLEESRAISLEAAVSSVDDTSTGDSETATITITCGPSSDDDTATSGSSSMNTRESAALQTSSSVHRGEPEVVVFDEQEPSLPVDAVGSNTTHSAPTASGQRTASGRARRGPTVPSTLEGPECLPQFLRVQQDMRDLLGGMAGNFEDFLRAQREAAVRREAEGEGFRQAMEELREARQDLREARQDYREGAAALREAATSQQELAASIGLLMAFLQRTVSR